MLRMLLSIKIFRGLFVQCVFCHFVDVVTGRSCEYFLFSTTLIYMVPDLSTG